MDTERVIPSGYSSTTRYLLDLMSTSDRRLPGLSHLANEDPNQPETPSKQSHETVSDEFPETVPLRLHNVHVHRITLSLLLA